MSNSTQNNHSQDDQVLAELYKKGAKETAPAKLNYEIINYAAQAKKSKRGSSHFSGDWKVPLSLAASVVVVFGLLVQLDQSPQQVELPPIPEISAPIDTTQTKADETEVLILEEAKEAMSEDIAPLSQERKETEFGTLQSVPNEERATNEPLSPTQLPDAERSKIQQKPTSKKRAESKNEYFRDRQIHEPALEKSKSFNIEGKSSQAASPSASTAGKEIIQQRTIETEVMQSRENTDIESDIASDSELDSTGISIERAEQEFAPIPVEDWLLMIEKLVARKDYAEAARQLQKFKQAHPKVNVEDLESKIP